MCHQVAHVAAPCLARAAGGAAVLRLLQDHQDSCVAVYFLACLLLFINYYIIHSLFNLI
jgi:hypothetical protein